MNGIIGKSRYIIIYYFVIERKTTMQKFLEMVTEVFEIEPNVITMETVFRDLDDFSSLVGFSLLVMMEEEYGVKVTVDEFMKCNTIGDLYQKCVKG